MWGASDIDVVGNRFMEDSGRGIAASDSGHRGIRVVADAEGGLTHGPGTTPSTGRRSPRGTSGSPVPSRLRAAARC